MTPSATSLAGKLRISPDVDDDVVAVAASDVDLHFGVGVAFHWLLGVGCRSGFRLLSRVGVSVGSERCAARGRERETQEEGAEESIHEWSL